MVLKFFLFAVIFLFASCTDIGKRDNPDDPDGINYQGSSSSYVEPPPPSSSSARQSSSSDIPFSSSSFVSSSTTSSSSVVMFSSSSKPSSSSLAQSSSSVVVSSSSSAIVSSSSSLLSSSSIIMPSSSSVCTANDNSYTHYCSNGTLKQYGSMTDGIRTYKTVVIGEQTWMAENLNYNCVDNTSYYWSCSSPGRVYDWATAMNLQSDCNSKYCTSQILSQHKGICPSGWHIPSDMEWTKLINFVGGISVAGTKLKATSVWRSDASGYKPGTDDFGFAALPGGYCNSDGYSCGYENTGAWLSASEYSNTDTYYWYVSYNDESVKTTHYYKSYMYRVRCVKD
ncbi:MAG: hypothetical protein FWF63_05035 [Fibromonadales bacterium]|nr:hypothetical protein [Fibromonadales bacterium]